VFVTTRGGPGEATLVTGFLVYRSAFLQNKTGYAAAIATILTLIILAISLVVRKFQAGNAWSKE
jgi:raffinose/stachyose/melibiose transport system permease protein